MLASPDDGSNGAADGEDDPLAAQEEILTKQVCRRGTAALGPALRRERNFC